MQPGDVLLVETTQMAGTGEAVAVVEGRRLLVPGGLPGERARVRIVAERGESLLGELLELQTRSPHRVTPACRHAGECGGCAWQQIAYPEQLRLKKRILETLLQEALGRGAPRVEPMLGMPTGADGMPWGFRHKAAFVFGVAPEGRGLVMGHFARGTHRVVPVAECPVHSPRANRIAFALRDELVRASVPVAFVERNGLLRHVVVRTNVDESEAAAVLVVTESRRSLRAPLERLLKSRERPTGLMLNLHDRPGPYLVGRETVRIDGQGHVKEDRLGPSFLVSPTGFFQTNVVAAAQLLRLVENGLPARSGLHVLDLYSGSGLFALPLARKGHVVTAVEESRKATRDAALNGRVNQVPRDRLRLTCARVEDAVGRLRGERFDAVILDPPRQGCPPPVLREVAERLRAERLILVSCNPEALSRELEVVLRAGYRARLVQPVDMFPHTPHVEAVAILERRARERSAERGRPERPRGRVRADAVRSERGGSGRRDERPGGSGRNAPSRPGKPAGRRPYGRGR